MLALSVWNFIVVRRSYVGPNLDRIEALAKGLAAEQLECFPFRPDYDDIAAALEALQRLKKRHGRGPTPAQLLGPRS